MKNEEGVASSLLCRHELCSVRATELKKMWLAAREGSQQIRSSPPGETAEAPPKRHRDKPSSRTNLAGGGK